MDTKTNKHIIDSMVFEVAVPAHRMALGVQNRVSALAGKEIPLLLEDTIASHDLLKGITRIEQIELDIGAVSVDKLEDTFCERLRQEFQTVLTQYVSSRDEGEGVRCLSWEQSLIESLDYFLHTGSLPWNADTEEFQKLDELVTKLLREKPDDILRLAQRIHSRDSARRRLIFNLNTSTLRELTAKLLGVSTGIFEDAAVAIEELIKIWTTAGLGIHPKIVFFEPILCELGYLQTVEDRPEYLFHLWLDLTWHARLLASKQPWQKLREEIAEHPWEQSRLTTVPVQSLVLEFLESKEDEIGPTVKNCQPLQLEKHSDPTVDEELEARQQEIPDEADLWPIRNSGLVFLWPYMSRYFEILGLVRDADFVDAEARIQAVHEMQFLAIGPRPYREYDLTLNKILCGLPLRHPVDPEYVPINEHEAEKVLQRAIENWANLGTMSLDGFRGSFILRPGRLSHGDGDWTLTVERKGYDILLENLTYSISVIRLPWMNDILYVEW